MNPDDLDAVHRYWFGQLVDSDYLAPDRFGLWFGSSPETDADLARRFGMLLAPARTADPRALSPARQAALVVVLDQFPRSIHRGTPEAYGFDEAARTAARAAIAGGLERFRLAERAFLVIPFSHSESLTDQQFALDLFDSAIAPFAPAGVPFYEAGRVQTAKYLDIVTRFGRFPHRNEALGRASTPQEESFLATARLAPF